MFARRILLLLVALLALSCRSSESAKYAAAGVSAGIAVAAAAANRAATDECWGACSHGYGCDPVSGRCVPLGELEGRPAPPPPAELPDAGCIVEDDGRRVCPDDLPSDLAMLLALLVELPELQIYLHPDVPDRVPLRFLRSPALTEEPPLTKFGQPVDYTDDDGAPHLLLKHLEVAGDRAIAVFLYPIEGVVGEVAFGRDDTGWRVLTAQLVEN